MKESRIEITTLGGVELEGRLVRLGRFEVVFDVFSPEVLLRTSEVLPRLKILSQGCVAYEGRATVTNLINLAGGVTCMATVEESGVFAPPVSGPSGSHYDDFQAQCLATYHIRPEFKVVVADVEIFLSNLRLWLEEMALRLPQTGGATAAGREKEFLAPLAPRIVSAFNSLHERFEDVSYSIAPEFRAVHQNFARRQLLPLFLCSPFGHRTFHKPLGYAGDYEMMNMIMRNTFEGNSFFARVMHYWLVNQWPAQSVRNRIAHLKTCLYDEVARVVREGRRARVMNLGCGPAWEIQEFVRETALSDEADFTLLDFNEETIQHTSSKLRALQQSLGRRAGVEMRQASVQQLMRSALQGRALPAAEHFDFIYCAGLFDYLSEPTCKAMVKLFLQWLRPGGLIVVANMNDAKPFRNMVEFLLDWHLIYRDSRFMATLCPDSPNVTGTVIGEPTSVNLFMQVRKHLAP